MKKSLLTLGLAALLGANFGATATDFAPVASVSPENYTVMLAKQDYVKDIDIVFTDAQTVTINDALKSKIGAGLANITGAMPSTVASYAVAAIDVTAIDGGIRISVEAKSTYGGENGFTYSAGTNMFCVALPEGLVTVTGTDGVDRPSEAMGLRYAFDNTGKVTPAPFSSTLEVTPDQLSDLVFPETVSPGTNSSALSSGIALFAPGATPLAAHTMVKNNSGSNGYFVVSRGSDGLTHAKWNGNAAMIEPGEYLVAIRTSYTLTADDKNQQGPWVWPIKVVANNSADVVIGVADGSALQSTAAPAFCVTSGDYTISQVAGSEITAEIDGTSYVLQFADGKLSFKSSDASKIRSKFLNKGIFYVTVNVPEKSLSMTSGEATANNNAASATFPCRIYSAYTSAVHAQKYYLKRLAYNDQLLNGNVLETTDLDANDYAFVASDATMSLTFADYATASRTYTLTNPSLNGSAMVDNFTGNPVEAYLLDNGNIQITNWSLVDGSDVVATGGDMLLVPFVENVPAKTSTVVSYDRVSDNLVATVTLPSVDVNGASLPDLTLVTAKCGDAVVQSTFAAPGATMLLNVIPSPEAGRTYDFEITTSLCNSVSETETVSFTHDPMFVADINKDYYVATVKCLHNGYNEQPIIEDLELGSNLELSGYDATMECLEVNEDGTATIALKNLFKGVDLYASLDIYTHNINFVLGEGGIYGSEDLCTFYMVNGTGTNPFNITPAKGSVNNGLLSINLFAFITQQEDVSGLAEQEFQPMAASNIVLFRATETKLIVNNHLVPNAPQISASYNSDENNVVVDVTLSDGSELDAATSGYNSLKVYRTDANGEALVYEATGLEHGATVQFTDSELTSHSNLTYKAYASNLNNAASLPGEAIVSTVGVQNVVCGEAAASTGVYNLQGIRVADTLEGLPAGLYIVNGTKVRR